MKKLILSLYLVFLSTGCGLLEDKIYFEPIVLQKPIAFSSCDEVVEYVKNSQAEYELLWRGYAASGPKVAYSQDSLEATGTSNEQITNIQESGVDEADMVKILSDSIVVARSEAIEVINRADLSVSSSVALKGQSEIKLYTHGDKLVSISRDINCNGYYCNSGKVTYFTYSKGQLTEDVSTSYDGEIVSSRLVSGRLILVVKNNYSINNYLKGLEIGISSSEDCRNLYRPSAPSFNYGVTTVLNIDVESPSSHKNVLSFLGNANEVYATTENIYLLSNRYQDNHWLYSMMRSSPGVSTDITKISIKDGDVEYKSFGSVKGYIRNQFSVKELEDELLSIATTTTQTGKLNHLFVLKQNAENALLKVYGSVENFAPTEDIRSVRYLKDMAYIVTFKKTDPLFAIDLSNPENPNILSELKIPGFSAYMHPLDDNTLIGVGYGALDMGSFAYFQGLQVSLFDIADPAEVSVHEQFQFGGRGSYTEVVDDHHAFYLDKQRNRLVLPVTVSEERLESDWRNTEYEFSGAIVFNLEYNDIEPVASMSHYDIIPEKCKKQLEWSINGWWENRQQPIDINRVFELDNALLSISKFGIKAHDLENPNVVIKETVFKNSENQCGENKYYY